MGVGGCRLICACICNLNVCCAGNGYLRCCAGHFDSFRGKRGSRGELDILVDNYFVGGSYHILVGGEASGRGRSGLAVGGAHQRVLVVSNQPEITLLGYE